MIDRDAYKRWLEQGGNNSSSQRTLIAVIQKIERQLKELGMPVPDLDTAWKEDRFSSLRERLRQIKANAKGGGQDYRILMPDSEKPVKRISDWISHLMQYGRFLDGEPPGPASYANRIRQHVLEHYT